MFADGRNSAAITTRDNEQSDSENQREENKRLDLIEKRLNELKIQFAKRNKVSTLESCESKNKDSNQMFIRTDWKKEDEKLTTPLRQN